MDGVERGDDVVWLREAFRDIALFKAHTVCHACYSGIRRSALNGGPEDVIADVPRLGKRLGQLDERPPAPTTYVGHLSTALQFRLHLRHGGNPLFGEQILKPALGEPPYTVPHVGHVGWPGDPAPGAGRPPRPV